MLSGAYIELGDDKRSLGALMLAYHKGLVEGEKKILNVVRMNIFLEVPFTAGSILEDAMAQGKVEENKKNLELLLSAWTYAREFDRAIPIIDKLFTLSNDGEYFVQKAQMLAEKTSWSACVDSAQSAIDKGSLKREGAAWLLLGICLTEMQQYTKALEAMNNAINRGNKSTRDQARGWIDYINDRNQLASATSNAVRL